MTRLQLMSNYDSMANAMKLNILAQERLLLCWKMGYDATQPLAQATTARYAAASLLKELDKARPVIKESDIQELCQEYCTFLNHCKNFGLAQKAYFDNTKDDKLKRHYNKAIENMKKRIHDYFTGTGVPKLIPA